MNGDTSTICTTCNKSFASPYSLKRHKARKTPCTKPAGFECERCGKIFKSNFYLSKHLLKKSPCLAPANIVPNRDTPSFNHQKEIMQLDHKQKLEIIRAKKEAILEVERERTSRKVQTPHIINNYNNSLHLEIHELKILNATFPAENIHDADINCLRKIIPVLNKDSNYGEIVEFMCKDRELNEINAELIGKTYNNEALPTQRNMVYSDESKTFYVVKNKCWVESDFKNIEELLSQTLRKYYKILCRKSASLTKPNKKSQDVYIKIKECAVANAPIDESKNLEDVAMKALNHSIGD
jgi:hypothetical protein